MAIHNHIAKRTTGWVELSHVSTDTAYLAIVDPCKGDVLWKRWREYVNGKLRERTVDSMPKFDQWHLERNGIGVPALLFDTGPDGCWGVVEGRFGPYLGEEGEPDSDDLPKMVLVELRIRLHDIDDCDDPDCDKAPGR